MGALKIGPQNRVFTKTGVRCHQNRGNLTLESHRRNRCNTNLSSESNFPKIEGPKIGGRLYNLEILSDQSIYFGENNKMLFVLHVVVNTFNSLTRKNVLWAVTIDLRDSYELKVNERNQLSKIIDFQKKYHNQATGIGGRGGGVF